MNKKILKGALAGTAVVALAAGGGTWASFSDFGNINGNSVGAGILKLNLNANGGGQVAPLNFGNLAPGQYGSKQAIFLASSDGQSVPTADLYMTIENLKDVDHGCSSNSEAQAEGGACNNPSDPGELSKVLDMLMHSYAAPDAAACAGYLESTPGGPGDPGPALNSSILPSRIGNLHDPAAVGKIKISGATPLNPGDGVCVVINSYWPRDKTGGISVNPLPVDNAAQGDSFTMDLRFDLEQHFSS